MELLRRIGDTQLWSNLAFLNYWCFEVLDCCFGSLVQQQVQDCRLHIAFCNVAVPQVADCTLLWSNVGLSGPILGPKSNIGVSRALRSAILDFSGKAF